MPKTGLDALPRPEDSILCLGKGGKMTQDNRYSIGGVLYPQPFKIRRLGHFGFNVSDLGKGRDFYSRQLGFRITEEINLGDLDPQFADMENGDVIFFSHNSDHHAFLLAHRSLGALFGDDAISADITMNQLTWQVNTLEEVVRAKDFFAEKGIEVRRTGRDMPGSNWHVYVRDPDGYTVELYYGMEQVGWDGVSKPRGLYNRSFAQAPPLPQISEMVEVEDAESNGVDLFSGYRRRDLGTGDFVVGAVRLPRPFRITRIGPLKIFVNDVSVSEDFYVNLMGFKLTETVVYKSYRCLFLRNGTEHHSLALLPKSLRTELELSSHTACASVGLELGSYQQLRDAVAHLKKDGVRMIDGLPPELSPGVDYSAHILDHDGHCLQLYYYMEQIGWDGQPRPAHMRRKVSEPWPETLEPMSDTYADDSFHGPLG
jgi:catechol 2,3-dioxygenase-like lactoylglutathione lyase family enzyme